MHTSFSAPHLVMSGVLNLTIVKGHVNGEEKTVVREAQLIPVVQRDFMAGDLPVIQLEKLETFSENRRKIFFVKRIIFERITTPLRVVIRMGTQTYE